MDIDGDVVGDVASGIIDGVEIAVGSKDKNGCGVIILITILFVLVGLGIYYLSTIN